jgi:hypothetical protein
MAGTTSSRLLRFVASHVSAGNADWTDGPEAIPPLRTLVDACHDVGRDPATPERTAGMLVGLPGGWARPGQDYFAGERIAMGPPVSGSMEERAQLLRGYAAEGITHVQVWIAPLTLAGIAAFAPVLGLLDPG